QDLPIGRRSLALYMRTCPGVPNYPEYRPLSHCDSDAVHGIVAEPAAIEALFDWLCIAIGINGTTHQIMFAGCGVPIELPTAPGIAAGRSVEPSVVPMTVDPHFDFHRRHAAARPRAPEDLDRTLLDQAMAGVEVGNAGWNHQRLDPHRGHRHA